VIDCDVVVLGGILENQIPQQIEDDEDDEDKGEEDAADNIEPAPLFEACAASLVRFISGLASRRQRMLDFGAGVVIMHASSDSAADDEEVLEKAQEGDAQAEHEPHLNASDAR